MSYRFRHFDSEREFEKQTWISIGYLYFGAAVPMLIIIFAVALSRKNNPKAAGEASPPQQTAPK